MNKKQLAEYLGNMDDRLIQQAEQVPHFTALRRRKTIRRLLATAAVLALMVSSFSVGAIAFAREVIVEVPAAQESVSLEEIGLTLILPDSWTDQYIVLEDTFAPNGSTMWEFCAKAVYDTGIPAEGAGEPFYRGTLFTIFRYKDHSMSADEFAQDELAGIGRYLFATEQATYVALYAGDVQYDPLDTAQASAYQALMAEVQDIQFVVGDLFGNGAGPA